MKTMNRYWYIGWVAMALCLAGVASSQGATVSFWLWQETGDPMEDGGGTPLAVGSWYMIIGTTQAAASTLTAFGLTSAIANSLGVGETLITYGRVVQQEGENGHINPYWISYDTATFQPTSFYVRFFDYAADNAFDGMQNWGTVDWGTTPLTAVPSEDPPSGDLDLGGGMANYTTNLWVIPEPGTSSLMMFAAALFCGLLISMEKKKARVSVLVGRP